MPKCKNIILVKLTVIFFFQMLVQLASSGPGTVRPGQNLNLVCKVTGISITSGSYAWNKSKNEYSLQFNSMSASDTAMYYCARVAH
uniref:Ig-like domain-containing protein n=1 Tax=Laticauda laticaudata TaxID=8630 RepID=A0A8C5S9S2_LATLA